LGAFLALKTLNPQKGIGRIGGWRDGWND